MEVCCEYKIVQNSYCCLVNRLRNANNLKLKFIGKHIKGKTDVDVTYISFRGGSGFFDNNSYCVISHVPQGLTIQFPNLERLSINSSFLQNISKCDLIEYKNFKDFDLSSNNITFLPGNLFEDFQNLESIDFSDNNLTVIEPNILDGLTKLNKVDFGQFLTSINVNIPAFQLYTNENVSPIKSALFEIFMQSDACHIKNFNIKLLKQSQNLKELNSNLQNEKQKIAQKYQQLGHENQVLRNQKVQSEQEILKGKQKFLKLFQMHSNLKTELAAKVLKDQQINRNFNGDMKTFIQDDTTKDFQIQIDGHEFHVHKFLLAARSPTLDEILKNNPEVENLNLVDISEDIFEKIFEYLYNDKLPDDGMNFLHLFAAAGKLKIEELKNYAAIKTMELIDAENALEILNLSNKYGHDELRQKAFEEIKKGYPKIEFKDDWINDGDKIEKILKYFMKMKELENDFMKMVEM